MSLAALYYGLNRTWNDTNHWAIETMYDAFLPAEAISAGHYSESGNHEDRHGLH